MSARHILQSFEAWRAAREPLVLATVYDTLGSTYSKAGHRILIAGSGDYRGLVRPHRLYGLGAVPGADDPIAVVGPFELALQPHDIHVAEGRSVPGGLVCERSDCA